MANASRKHFGAGSQGKGSGSGANTELKKDMVGDNMALSNRDKSENARARGADGKAIENEQLQDQAANRLSTEE